MPKTRWFYPVLILLLLIMTCKKDVQSDAQRYVVLSPEVAEILVAIGAGERIVGVTEECNEPELLKSITRVGKFGMVDREKIISLQPSLIFCSGLEQEALADEFTKLGYKCHVYYPTSLKAMYEGIVTLGTLTQLTENAKAVADSIQSQISAIQIKLGEKRKPRVYLEIYRDPLMSVSNASLVGELIAAAGGENIFPTLERDYARVKAEDVLSGSPDVMICYSQDTLANVLSRKGWQKVPAIRDKRVYFEADINPDWLLRAGPRISLGINALYQILYGDESGS